MDLKFKDAEPQVHCSFFDAISANEVQLVLDSLKTGIQIPEAKIIGNALERIKMNKESGMGLPQVSISF